ncbi:gamma-glutamyltransferase [bacterium]|nr:gamma-glutamyltransferase [bacterium]
MKFFNYVIGFMGLTAPLMGTPILSNMAIHHPVIGTHGMVVSQEARATGIGIDVLNAGGNAIDAAIAVGFALAVTHPQAGNLGGGGFMMIHIASENKTIALDFRETAPAAAHADLFLNSDGTVNTHRARFSTQSSGVPGSVHGLLTALDHYGTLPRKRIIAPAIRLAKGGFSVSHALAVSLKQARPRLEQDAYTSAIFYPNDRALKPGDRLSQAALAQTLSRISKYGIAGFYSGKTAQAIDTFMKNTNGLITLADLRNYQSVVREPLHIQYRGQNIYTMPLPSSGGLIMAQILKLIEPFPLKTWGANSAKTIHAMAEAMQLAYADRAEWLGDSDFVRVPVQQLLSESYLNRRRKHINLNQHTPSVSTKFGQPYDSDETTHYSVMDQWGNAVSVTTTLNFSYGSGISIPGTGVLLNNEMDDFSAKPGEPNAYGLLGNAQNAIAPHKRMLSSMTPTLVLNDTGGVLVTGSPGGSRIISTVTQIISNVIDHGMTLAQASAAGRFHHQGWPDELRIEPHSLSPDTQAILRRMGHTVVTRPVMGSTQSIMKQEGVLYGVSDTRTPGGQALGDLIMIH